MFIPKTLHQRHPNESPFREKRLAHLSLPSLSGTVKTVGKEGAGVAKKTYNWLVTPKSWKGWIGKFPFYATHYAFALPYRGAKFAGRKGVDYAKKAGAPYADYGWKLAKVGVALPKSAYHLSGGPFVEAFKSFFPLLAKRALLDNTRTGVAGMFNIPYAGLSQSWEALKNTALYPLHIVNGIRESVRNAVSGTRMLVNDTRSGIKTLLGTVPAKALGGVLKTPWSYAKIPLRMAGEAGLTAASYGVNLGRVAATPVESVVNGYRSMKRGFEIVDGVQHTFEVGHAKSLRERFGDLFQQETPLMRLASPQMA